VRPRKTADLVPLIDRSTGGKLAAADHATLLAIDNSKLEVCAGTHLGVAAGRP
jgi:hypothetical protein